MHIYIGACSRGTFTMLATISRASLRPDHDGNAKLACFCDGCGVIHRWLTPNTEEAVHTCFDFMESTQSMELLLKANKRQKSSGAFESSSEQSPISERSEKIIFQSVKWMRKKMSRLLTLKGGKCWFNSALLSSKSCRSAFIWHLFKSLSGGPCSVLKSPIPAPSQSNHSSTKVRNPFPHPQLNLPFTQSVISNSASLVCGKHFAITFITSRAWKEWMWLKPKREEPPTYRPKFVPTLLQSTSQYFPINLWHHQTFSAFICHVFLLLSVSL